MAIDWSAEGSDLARAIEELTELLVGEEPLATVLESVTELACTAIEGCDLASVTAMRDEMFETVAHTHVDALTIDEAQYADDRGPCLYAYRRNELVSVPSMSEGDSWAEFRAAAVACGVGSSFSLPMATGTARVGALNLYSHTENAFNEVPPAAALLFAKQAAAAIWTARTQSTTRELIRHLETALATREVIGMAKGVIMADHKVTPDDAFALLVKTSQNRNVKLRDLATEIVASGASPVA